MRLMGRNVLPRVALTVALFASLCATPSGARENPQPAAQGQQAPAPPPDQQKPDGYAIEVTVPVVNLDVTVTDDNGNYLTDLKKENFHVTEDGVPQVVTNFSTTEAPITVVLLVEYSKLGYGYYLLNAANWANVFLSQLKPTDWIALESFNLNTQVEVDFTHDVSDVRQGLVSMYYPPFSESNLFDALSETVDRLATVKGRKSILVLASGYDTFSKLTLSKFLARMKETNVTINCVGVGEIANMLSGVEYAQAQNQLRTIASLTGGRTWFPRFDADVPGLMTDVAHSLRNQYTIAYSPSNRNMDGKYRKIKVELVAPDGGPLTILNQKGKKVNFHVYARQGYNAPTSNVTN
jgi:VWFA-related protein